MRLVLIEDEAPALRQLMRLVDEVIPSAQVVATFDSVKSAVAWFEENRDYDLIVSDIQLSDGLSLNIFNEVKIDKPVIFTTAFNQYAIDAFKVNSVDYLLKPVKAEELRKAIEKYNTVFAPRPASALDTVQLMKQILQQENSYKTRLLVRFRDELKSIPTEDIAFFYSENKITHLFTTRNEMYIADQNLEALEGVLDPQKFFRANRQFIIAFKAIKSNHSHFNGKIKVILAVPTKDEIIVSREKAPQFKEWLGE